MSEQEKKRTLPRGNASSYGPIKDGVPDQVNHPPHYNQGGIECIAAIKAALTPEEFRGFLKGNVLKYVWRERGKGGGQDLEKAQWYLKRIKEGDES